MVTISIAYIVVLMGPYGYIDKAHLSGSQNYGWTKEQCETIILPLREEMKNQIGSVNYYACMPYPQVLDY